MTNPLSINTSLLNGSNYPLGNNFNQNTGAGTLPSGTGGSLFGPYQSNNSYSNDFMMSGFDFDSLAYDAQTGTIVQQRPAQNTQSQTLAAPQQQNGGELNFSSNPTTPAGGQTGTNQPQGANLSELDNYLVPDVNNAQQKPSNTGKIAGTTIGFLAPVAERIISGAKSGSIMKALNFKQLATTCPIIALAGFGVGYIVDKFINVLKSNKANPVQTNGNTQQLQTTVQVPVQQQYQQFNIAA